MDQDTKDRLNRRLVRLGDMMGDGLHHEPDGKWIEKEYKSVLRSLGIGPKRRNRAGIINENMERRIKDAKCGKCEGRLKQTRSGSMRASCLDCGSIFQLMRFKKR